MPGIGAGLSPGRHRVGDGADPSWHDQAGHDHQDIELQQTDHGARAGRVHDCVVRRVEHSGDQHAGLGAAVEPAR